MCILNIHLSQVFPLRVRTYKGNLKGWEDSSGRGKGIKEGGGKRRENGGGEDEQGGEKERTDTRTARGPGSITKNTHIHIDEVGPE